MNKHLCLSPFFLFLPKNENNMVEMDTIPPQCLESPLDGSYFTHCPFNKLSRGGLGKVHYRGGDLLKLKRSACEILSHNHIKILFVLLSHFFQFFFVRVTITTCMCAAQGVQCVLFTEASSVLGRMVRKMTPTPV